MKVKDVTPKRFSCTCGACPAVFETDRGTYLVIGKKVDSPDDCLSGKIGLDETIIEVPSDLIKGIKTE